MKYLLALLLLILFSGCGPIQSTIEINQAKVKIKSAYRVGAHKTAPYHFYKAKAYLYKAKDERAYSDFEEAKELAIKAKELSIEAKNIASKDKSGLLEENELKLEHDSTTSVDAADDIETKNVIDREKLEKEKVEDDDDLE